MLGYYDKPEATDQKIRDGWLHTGDMADSKWRKILVQMLWMR